MDEKKEQQDKQEQPEEPIVHNLDVHDSVMDIQWDIKINND